MRVYVSGSSDIRERERVKWAMESIRGLGFTVAHDWVAQIEAVGGKANRGFTREERRRYASEALQIIRRETDVFWLLLPTTPTCGVWAELAAFHAEIGLFVRASVSSGADPERTIFEALTLDHFDHDPDALKWIHDHHAERTGPLRRTPPWHARAAR